MSKYGLSSGNARQYWDEWKGEKSTTTPKVGAIMVWGGTYGHVAIVEEVINNDTVLTSESDWGVSYSSAVLFTNRTRSRNRGSGGWSYYDGYTKTFYGFLYPPFKIDGSVDPQPTKSIKKNKMLENYMSTNWGLFGW